MSCFLKECFPGLSSFILHFTRSFDIFIFTITCNYCLLVLNKKGFWNQKAIPLWYLRAVNINRNQSPGYSFETLLRMTSWTFDRSFVQVFVLMKRKADATYSLQPILRLFLSLSKIVIYFHYLKLKYVWYRRVTPFYRLGKTWKECTTKKSYSRVEVLDTLVLLPGRAVQIVIVHVIMYQR